MARRAHHIVVTYDIRDPKRLVRVGKIMKDYGQRVLKSVFECNIATNTFESMKARVEDVIDPMEDSVRYYFLCDKCLRNNEISGQSEVFKEDEAFVIT